MTKGAEYSRRYRERHPDRVRETLRRYRETHPRTPEQYTASNDRARRKKVRYIHEQLTRCVDCGETDIRVLEWDHVTTDGTPNRSPTFVAATKGLAAVKQEIAKCVVRCANCHSRRHYEEREGKWLRER